MDIRIPVTWEVCGTVHIEANSIEEALTKFDEMADYIRLPDGEYVDGSFEITCRDKDFIEMFNPECTFEDVEDKDE